MWLIDYRKRGCGRTSVFFFLIAIFSDGELFSQDMVNTSVIFDSTAEVTSGVFCGCLPILPRFFQYYTSKIKKTLSTTFRGRVQKVSQASWPKDYENHNSTKFESAGSDGRYLELNSYARSTNLWLNMIDRNSNSTGFHFLPLCSTYYPFFFFGLFPSLCLSSIQISLVFSLSPPSSQF